MLTLGNVTIRPGFWVMLLLAVAAGAGEVLLPVAAAALCHELGHLVALRLFGVHVEGISFTAFGAEIQADTRYTPYWQEIICVLAGPAVNLILAVFLSRGAGAYLLAGANLLQGIFNLLPLPGQDGSRTLHLAFSWWLDPLTADRVCRKVEIFCAVVMCAVSVILVLRLRAGLLLPLAAFGVFRCALDREDGK